MKLEATQFGQSREINNEFDLMHAVRTGAY